MEIAASVLVDVSEKNLTFIFQLSIREEVHCKGQYSQNPLSPFPISGKTEERTFSQLCSRTSTQ
jgi:hypothetical protein